MASMISMSSQIAIQEKGSRNKRKFRADPPVVDPDIVITEHQSESTCYEISSEKPDVLHSSSCCDMCGVKQEMTDSLKLDLGLSCPTEISDISPCIPREEIEANKAFDDANWNDLTESELEQLVLSNLETIFKSAIKKIVAYGYNEELATKAVLRSGLCYGCKDMVSNIVDNTLAFLNSGQEIDTLKEPYFEDLRQMQKYILAELVCVLKEVGPSLSNGDAMWLLLICDMNIAHACAMETDHIDGDSNGNSFSSVANLNPIESKLLKPSKPICSALPEATKNASIPNNSFQSEALTNTLNCSKPSPFSSSSGENFNTPNTVEKFMSSRKPSGITKREYTLRQKSIHLEKHYRSKGGSRAGKTNGFGGLIVDKKLNPISDSSNVNTKNALKINKGIGVEASQDKLNQNKALNIGFPLVPVFNSGAESTNSAPNLTSSVHNAELSLSIPAKISYNPMRQLISHDKKDEVIVKLVPRVRELENQLQEWTEWANQKVMQAARRLGKDKAELKTQRQEKEEIERLKKEKQVLEENTLKKLSEMENALRKASGQVEKAHATVRRLEVENTIIEREMLDAKVRAAESAASFEEALRREKNNVTKCQPWEKQKALYQEDLGAEKSTFLQLQKKLEQAQDVRNQLESRQKQEKQSKEEILAQGRSLEKEKQQIEISTKSKEDSMKLEAENNLRKYKDEIEILEKEISQLRLKTDSSKIAALKLGIEGSKLKDSRNIPISNDTNKIHCINSGFSEFEDYKQNSGVKRERECVMCLSEEMSVVFLPCAHQVVCTMCNELHEKQGMKDCPSCRTIIQQRVSVRFATK